MTPMLFLTSNVWVFFALLSSVSSAVLMQVNQHLKMQGAVLVLARSFFGVLFLIPFIWQLPWPEHIGFYGYCVLAALCAFLGDLLLFNAARRFGGRLASMFMPVKIFIAFGLWLVLDPVFFQAFSADATIISGVVLCLLFSSGGVLLMRGNDASWSAFKPVFFIGILFALLDVFIKLGAQGEDRGQVALLFAFACYMVHVPFAGGLLFFKKEQHYKLKLMPPGRGVYKPLLLLMVGTLIGGLSALNAYTINMAVILSPNPGYVAVLMLLSIVWLSLYNRARKVDDRAPLVSILLLILGAIGLIVLTV